MINLNFHFHCEVDQLKEQIMSALDDLKAKVADLQASVEDGNAKQDQMIALIGGMRQQIIDLGNGDGATKEQLLGLAAQIDQTLTDIQAQKAEDDAALAG
jgi:peptidoglycan hydrolase CwlO-like protein